MEMLAALAEDSGDLVLEIEHGFESSTAIQVC